MAAIEVRKAQIPELDAIMPIIDAARGIMRADGNMQQWTNGYPSRDVIAADIEQGHGHVCLRNGVLVGYFALIEGPDPTYLRIYEGEWSNLDAPYYVMHRLASTPNSHGVFAAAMDYAFGVCPNLRVDTHRHNRIMQRKLLRYGFVYCGIIYLTNGDERLAYQRIID